jgi:alpha-tubulin suppressor-like RCC1 family protein
MAIKTDSTLWTWGNNGYGRLGLGNTTSVSSPVQVGALTNWLRISTSTHNVLSIKTDGTLWSWGHNDGGKLGLGDTNNRSSPVQVGALTTWTSIAAGQGQSLAIG